jgi:anti-anti-sigma factor
VGCNGGEKAFEVSLERSGGGCVVVFRGDLDLNAADELWHGIELAATAGPVVLDLTDTTFMDSTGVKLLLRAYMAHGAGAEAVTLRAPSDPVVQTLAVAGIHDIFRIEERGTLPIAGA